MCDVFKGLIINSNTTTIIYNPKIVKNEATYLPVSLINAPQTTTPIA